MQSSDPKATQTVELKTVDESSPAPAKSRPWIRVTSSARTKGQVAALLATLVLGGGTAGFLIASTKNGAKLGTANEPTKVENLSPEDLKKLSQAGTALGDSGQTLTIGANSLFKGRVDIASDLTLGGRLNANGPVSFSGINSAGQSSFGGVNIGQNLQVDGAARVGRGLTVEELLSVTGNANVTGGLSARTVTADTVATKQLQLSGPFVLGHIATQGPTPSVSVGGAAGRGGTANISGNDTAGTINVNVGSSSSPGLLASVAFRAPYAPSVRVIISPLSGSAAAANAYVTRNANGFQIHGNPGGGGTLSFDYIVVQ